MVEKFENARLPEKIRIKLASEYPDWNLLKDKFLYIQKNGEVKRKEYKIIMKKENKVKRIVVDENGTIIRGKS